MVAQTWQRPPADAYKKNNVSSKIMNSSQFTYEVDDMLNKKNKNKKLEFKIKNLGNKILTLTLNEINIYINKQ